MKKVAISSVCCLLISFVCFAATRHSCQPNETPSILKDYKRARLLKGNKGELLGYIYIKEDKRHTNGVLTDLLVVKENGLKTEILYRIDSKGFFNSKGKAEFENHTKKDNEFKLAKQL